MRPLLAPVQQAWEAPALEPPAGRRPAWPRTGLLLPCNVVVSESPEGAVVQVMKPEAMLGLIHTQGMKLIADEADARLRRALDHIGAS